MSKSELINSASEDGNNGTDTPKNTVLSTNFMVWKFCGKAQFPHSFGQCSAIKLGLDHL